jgi:hypothetical protein
MAGGRAQDSVATIAGLREMTTKCPRGPNQLAESISEKAAGQKPVYRLVDIGLKAKK